MKFYSYANSLQEQINWKDQSDTKSVIIAKNVKNDLPTNSKPYIKGKNCFTANPIRHYRKQYFSSNNSSTRQSIIGTLDKPGSNIVSNKECGILIGENLNNVHNIHILNKNQTDCVNSNECKRIKRATTVINKKDDNYNYSSSYREHLNRRCKTYIKNLPEKSYTNKEEIDCEKSGNCNIYYYPSNSKYMVQGPVTSSSRIANLKNREKNMYKK